MTVLLEYKEKLTKFWGKHEAYLQPLVRFAIALATFLTINANIGYMDRISNFPIALILALICAVLPMNGTIIVTALVVVVQFYALSVEVSLVALAVFILIYFLYFRFAPKNGYSAILTPICFKWNIPYIMPVGVGLLREAYSISALIFGTIIYYFLDGVRLNETLLSETTDESETATSKFVITLNQLFGNKEMYLALVIIVVAALLVYFIRRMSIDHAWMIAIVAGILFELVGFFVGYLMLGVSGKTLWLIIGNIISLCIAFVVQFFCFNLDYSRTENLQFEDDEYYYYVKAVPKVYVSSTDKKVKYFGQKEEQERLNKKRLAEEMDIDEDLFD